jgi:hypothetical protein
MIAAVLLFSVLAVYVACFRPAWVWTMLIGSSLVLELLSFGSGGLIYVGGLQLRIGDPALFGVVIGTFYFLHRSSIGVLRRKPLILTLLLILGYLLLKVVWSLVFGQQTLASNQVASHALGGLVATVGELRDDLPAFLIPLYVYVAPGSRDLKKIALPLLVAAGLILMRAAGFIAITGQIWSNNAEFRYVTAQEAIDLTVISFILLFITVPRVPKFWSRSIAGVALFTATFANHRSQWVGLAAGGAVLVVAILGGRPFIGNRKVNRLVFSSVILFSVGIAAAFTALGDYIARNSLLSALSVRLYAITQPTKDADASWRQAIWHDRIQQVGENWPWGRFLGDRRLTLFHGSWLAVPDHSAYVTIYELGGVILCCLVGVFWVLVIITSLRFLRVANTAEQIWPPVIALSITACSLAFGSAYDFPLLGPVFSVILLINAQQRLTKTRASLAARPAPPYIMNAL